MRTASHFITAAMPQHPIGPLPRAGPALNRLADAKCALAARGLAPGSTDHDDTSGRTMTLAFHRALPCAVLSCVLPAAAADGPTAASSPAPASVATPARVHIEDAACWPRYPDEFRAAGVSGRSTIRLSVDAGGVVRHVYIESASGPTPAHRILDGRVAAALAACRIDAARDARGQPTAGDTLATWTWSVPAAVAGGSGTPASGAASVGMPPVPIMSDPACRPSYPNVAVREGATGVTQLRIDVDAGGHAVASAVLQSAGPTRAHRLLDEAVASAMATCPFRPALDEGGTAVAGAYDLTYTWRLE